MNISGPLRSLRHRNYRLYLAGQAVSLVGTWMQQIALSWLVYQLTSSPTWLGVTAFAGQIPSLLVAPLAGVLVERWNRHRVLIVTQSLAMLQAFALGALELLGDVPIAVVIGLSVFYGVVIAFDTTCRQSFMFQLVDRRADLPNAIALNSTVVNAARLIGPALAAFVLYETSAGICFLLNGVSYLAVLVALLAIRVSPRRAPSHAPLFEGLRVGLRYVLSFHPIRDVLSLLALISFSGLSYMVLLPVMATEQLGGSARTYGFLSAATGVGAITAAIMLANRTTVLGLGRWITVATALLGTCLSFLALGPGLWISLLLLLLVGFAHMMAVAASNSVLQTIVDEDKRARVMSLFTMAFLGVGPIGNLLTGLLAEAAGTNVALVVIGLSTLFGAFVFARQLPALRRTLRPLYEQLGILPPVAAGMQSASELSAPPHA
jgi:MFS family permease